MQQVHFTVLIMQYKLVRFQPRTQFQIHKYFQNSLTNLRLYKGLGQFKEKLYLISVSVYFLAILLLAI